MDALTEYLSKLNRLAAGALNTISGQRADETLRKSTPVYTDAQWRQNWWDGYLQAVADITDFAVKHETAP